jgi:hypothetical protein
MKNFKTTIVAIIALILGVGGSSAYLGFSGNESGVKFNIYGTDAGTTKVTSTSKTFNVGSSESTLNLNIKTSSTDAQTIAILPEFSNESDDCANATYFRQALSTNTSGAVAAATSTITIQVPASPSTPYYQNVQIQDLNTECMKLTFTGSSSTVTSMLWIEGIKK